MLTSPAHRLNTVVDWSLSDFSANWVQTGSSFSRASPDNAQHGLGFKISKPSPSLACQPLNLWLTLSHCSWEGAHLTRQRCRHHYLKVRRPAKSTEGTYCHRPRQMPRLALQWGVISAGFKSFNSKPKMPASSASNALKAVHTRSALPSLLGLHIHQPAGRNAGRITHVLSSRALLCRIILWGRSNLISIWLLISHPRGHPHLHLQFGWLPPNQALHLLLLQPIWPLLPVISVESCGFQTTALETQNPESGHLEVPAAGYQSIRWSKPIK